MIVYMGTVQSFIYAEQERKGERGGERRGFTKSESGSKNNNNNNKEKHEEKSRSISSNNEGYAQLKRLFFLLICLR